MDLGSQFQETPATVQRSEANIRSCPVPVLPAEDESAIIGQVTYHHHMDELFGFCGVNEQQHACLDHFSVVAVDGEEGFMTIINAFKEYKIGTFGTAILLNTLHPNLCRIADLVMPTCNRFDHHFVYRQWQEQELKSIFGPLSATALMETLGGEN